MLKKLTEFSLRFVDLLEAEGRAAKHHALELAVVLALLLTSALLLALGAAALAAALFLGLQEVMHEGWALCVVASIVVVLGLTGVFFGSRLAKSRRGS